jgi:hypothetical protein
MGWTPWLLEFDRNTVVHVENRRCTARLYTYLHERGCRTGGMIQAPKGGRLPGEKLVGALELLSGPGMVAEQKGRIEISRGLSRLEEFRRKDGIRRLRKPIRLPTAPRSRLIRRFLSWLRTNERLGWSGMSVLFRLSRGFRAEGVRWLLFSDLYFYRGEGLYWNHWLTSKELRLPTFRRLMRLGFYDRVRKDLERRKFRVGEPHPQGLWFDQDFLPSLELTRRASEIVRWIPSSAEEVFE